MKKEEEDIGFLRTAGLKRRRLMAAESHHVPRPSSTWNYAPKPA